LTAADFDLPDAGVAAGRHRVFHLGPWRVPVGVLSNRYLLRGVAFALAFAAAIIYRRLPTRKLDERSGDPV
jgi:hypothetical protein